MSKPTPTKSKPTIAIDFDGCIHSYEDGWRDGAIYGTVVRGFWPWVEAVREHFRLVVHSSRAGDPAQAAAMMRWLHDAWADWTQGGDEEFPLEIAATKPPAWITIDDRCFRFEGNWNDPGLKPGALFVFKPWMLR